MFLLSGLPETARRAPAPDQHPARTSRARHRLPDAGGSSGAAVGSGSRENQSTATDEEHSSLARPKPVGTGATVLLHHQPEPGRRLLINRAPPGWPQFQAHTGDVARPMGKQVEVFWPARQVSRPYRSLSQ